ncbi:MAG: hypothetical protein Q4A78_05750 [Peptostreptococcaceae bacterium]|nr:hypothetical protein [Peptostreptococcaceae bacterium]
MESGLADEFGGFDIVLVEQGGMTGLYVQPKNAQEGGGCSSCSGCH